MWYDFLGSYPVRFYRQKVIFQSILDFYCADAKLAVEPDGSQHFDPNFAMKDECRTAFLKEYGIEVIRIPNNEVTYHFRGVCEYIDLQVNNRLPKREG